MHHGFPTTKTVVKSSCQIQPNWCPLPGRSAEAHATVRWAKVHRGILPWHGRALFSTSSLVHSLTKITINAIFGYISQRAWPRIKCPSSSYVSLTTKLRLQRNADMHKLGMLYTHTHTVIKSQERSRLSRLHFRIGYLSWTKGHEFRPNTWQETRIQVLEWRWPLHFPSMSRFVAFVTQYNDCGFQQFTKVCKWTPPKQQNSAESLHLCE